MDRNVPDLGLKRTFARASDGDDEAWRILVAQYAPRVFALVVRQSGDRELAEEITQATFVKVVSALERYNELGRFEPWLFRIARKSSNSAITSCLAKNPARCGSD